MKEEKHNSGCRSVVAKVLGCLARISAHEPTNSGQRILEICLIVVIIGILCLLICVPQHWMIILNLFFLPVSASCFFLGRYQAGIMALLCVLSTIVVLTTSLFSLPGQSILMTVISITIWGSVLGLTAILIGTLSDERMRRFREVYISHRTDSFIDPLTKIANRRAFEQESDRRLKEWELRRQSFALLLIDIDHFKKLNDTYGHPAGDSVLHDVARSLQSSLREGDLIARYGGEEFVVILPKVDPADAKKMAERARNEIENNSFHFEKLKLRLTVSIGISSVLSGDDSSSLLQRADDALYLSKQKGRNCVHFHNGEECEHFGAPLAQIEDSPTPCDGQHDANNLYDDMVTGLPSRKVLVEELNRRIEEARRYKIESCLMLVQVHDFHRFSANGAAFEMKALSVLSMLMRGVVRNVDLLVRFSADQFAVLMPSTTLEQATIPAERLQKQVVECDYVRFDGKALKLGVAVGLSDLSEIDDTASVLAQAMIALEASMENPETRTMIYRKGEVTMAQDVLTS